MDTAAPRILKTCFVTIGATASFDSLISAVLSPSFLAALQNAGYTRLLIQHGKGGEAIYRKFLNEQHDATLKNYGVDVTGFDFNARGLGQEMRAAKGEDGGAEGVVVSHAGSGSILDALRISVPLIVVPNPELLDNHQIELAEELALQGYVVHGKLDNLPAAIEESEALRQKTRSWPPVNSGEAASSKGLIGVMDDEMGFLD